jgi:hypothetical protein
MPKTSKKVPGADEIAEMASRGEDISAHFTNKFKVVRPVRRVNISTFQSGAPLTFTAATNNSNSYGGTPRPNVTLGCDKSVSGSAQSRVGEWYNTACFTAPPAFSFGSESRTDPNLRAAGVANWDFATFKDTTITERFTLQFRAEIFNIFNRVQFSPPNTTVGSSTFGQVTAQANNPRLVQLALRLRF